jgi:nucleoside-diphosphate-sugar epimerase
MRIFVMEAEGDIGARIATQLIDHGHQVVGAYRSHRNAGRVRGLSAESAALGQPACVRPRIAGCS